MRICLAGTPSEPGSGLGQLAENLLMFDRVALRSMDGDEAAGVIEQIPLGVLEELVETGALVLAVRSSYPVALQGPAQVNSRIKGLEAFRLVEEFHGFKIGTVSTIPGSPSFADSFEERAKRAVPHRLREALLSKAQVVAFDDQALLAVSKLDMENPVLRRKALYTVQKMRLQPPPDWPNPQGFDEVMATMQVMNANCYISEAGMGYSVVGESSTQSLIQTKLENVFTRDVSVIKQQAFRELLELHQLPSVETMFKTGALNWPQIARIRRVEGKAFRKWFQDMANRPAAETKEVLQEYTKILAAASKSDPRGRRTMVFLLEQAAGVLGQALGISGLGVAASAMNSLVLPELSKTSPYMMFDFLDRRVRSASRRS